MSDFGTFSFGRMGGVASSAGSYDIVYSIADAFDGGDNDILGLRISDRYDNMVTYQSPKFSDVQATAQYSFKQDNKSETDTGAEGTPSRAAIRRSAPTALTATRTPFGIPLRFGIRKSSTSRTSASPRTMSTHCASAPRSTPVSLGRRRKE